MACVMWSNQWSNKHILFHWDNFNSVALCIILNYINVYPIEAPVVLTCLVPLRGLVPKGLILTTSANLQGALNY